MASLAFRAGGPVAIAALAGLFVLAPARHDDRTVSASQDQDTSISATLKDQVDLAVTVYNSNIALVRDVRQVALPGGALDLSLLDIAASVNPATVHVRSLSEPSKLGVLEQNYQYDLLDPQRLLRKYVGPRGHARAHAAGERHDASGGSARAAARLQRRAGVEDRQRDRHRAQRGTVPVSRDSRQPAQPAHAGLEAGQQRRTAAPDRDVVPRRQHVVERRLRADRRARRPARRSRRLGHGEQLERHGVPQRAPAAGGWRAAIASATKGRWPR